MHPQFVCKLHANWGYLCSINIYKRCKGMTQKKNFQPSPMGTARKDIVTCGKGFGSKEFSAVVYENFSGFPLLVTFLGDKWWITTPGMKLQPLEEWFEGEDASFRFLCEAGGTAGALALAQMLGQALEFPEDEVQTTLHCRVDALHRLGVKFDTDDEHLPLELHVFKLPEKCSRSGKYAAWCRLLTDADELLFDIDGFDTAEEAKDYCELYFEVLKILGISFTV